jgi:peptidyl-prolyl cis-trans isomerase C
MCFERRSLLLVLALSFGGCTSAKEPAERADAGGGRVLATVNGTPITEEKFLERIRSGGAASAARAKTKTGRLAILDSMIRNELLWQEAQKRGLRRHRQVRDAVNPALVKTFLGEEFEKTLKIDQVDPREVQRIYRERWDEFHFPETYRLGVMHMRDMAAARAMMKKLAAGDNDEDLFEMLASGPDNLDDKLRATEGNIGYLPMSKMREVVPAHLRAVYERIYTTDEVPEIVDTPQGVFIVMMTGHRAPVVREFDEVRDGLRQQAFRELRERRLNEFVASFTKKHDVETHHDRLDVIPQYQVPTPGTSGPGGTRRRDAGPDGSTPAAADGGTPAAIDGGPHAATWGVRPGYLGAVI